jgi:hypothetical protein
MLAGDGDSTGCAVAEFATFFMATKDVADTGDVAALTATEYWMWIVDAHPAFLSSFDVGEAK